MAQTTRSRRITIDLGDPVFDAFRRFAEAAYPAQPLSAAVREACIALMAVDPMEATRFAARRAAWLATARAARVAFATAFAAARQNLDTTGTQLEELVSNA